MIVYRVYRVYRLSQMSKCNIQSINIETATQFSSFWLYPPPQWIWNKINRMSFNCRLSALNWGYLHIKSGELMGITKVSWSEVDYSLIISASIKWVKGIYIWKLLLPAVNESQRDFTISSCTICIVQYHFVQYMGCFIVTIYNVQLY